MRRCTNYEAVQDKVDKDRSDAVLRVDLQGKRCLVADGHLDAAGKTSALKVRDRKVVIAFGQDDEFLTIVFNGVIPIHAGVGVLIGVYSKFLLKLVFDSVRIDKVHNLRLDNSAGDEFFRIAAVLDHSAARHIYAVIDELLDFGLCDLRRRHTETVGVLLALEPFD